jgi:acyl dehydratase
MEIDVTNAPVFEDFAVGQAIGPIRKGRITTAHIMRWSASVENWHRIHYDQAFATGHDGLPGVVINGSWKQHILVQLMKDTLGPRGWLWKIKFRYRKLDVAGEPITALGEVTDTAERDGLGFITCRIRLEVDDGGLSTDGYALGVLPLRGGAEVPYPFVPAPAQASLSLPAE